MPKPNKYADTFKSILTCKFLSVRVKLKKQKHFALGCFLPPCQKPLAFRDPFINF